MKKGLVIGIIFLGLILIGLVGVSAVFSGGDGTENNPYQITTFYQLNEVRDYPSAHFKLMNDINCEGYDYYDDDKNPEPKEINPLFSCYNFDSYRGVDIGQTYENEQVFNGVFDGQGYQICGLKITQTQDYYTSLFGCVDKDAIIKNLILVGIEVGDQGDRAGFEGIGAVAGYNKGTIENVHVVNDLFGMNYKGVIAGEGGKGGVGGLVGINEGVIYRSSSNGGFITGGEKVGGLVGENRNQFWYPQQNEKEYYSSNPQKYPNGNPYRNFNGLSKLNPSTGYKSEPYNDYIRQEIINGGGGKIIESYSYSRVEGTDAVGGLVGENNFHIIDCLVNGYMSRTHLPSEPGIVAYKGVAGGIVGYNGGETTSTESNLGVVENCYASNIQILGTSATGGLVGVNDGGQIIKSFFGTETDNIKKLVGAWGNICNRGSIIESGGGSSDPNICAGVGSSTGGIEYITQGNNIGLNFVTKTQVRGYLVISTTSSEEVNDYLFNNNGAWSSGGYGNYYVYLPTTFTRQIDPEIRVTKYDIERQYCGINAQCSGTSRSVSGSWNTAPSGTWAIWKIGSDIYFPHPILSWMPLIVKQSEYKNERCEKLGDECMYPGPCQRKGGIVLDGFEDDCDNTLGYCCDIIDNIKEAISEMYWTKAQVKKGGEVDGIIKGLPYLTLEYEIRRNVVGLPDDIAKKGEITSTNNDYVIKWDNAGWDEDDIAYENNGEKYHFRIKIKGKGEWISTKYGVNMDISKDPREVMVGGNIPGCTSSNQCWLEDSHCTASCICETGYSLDGSGGCTLADTKNCGTLHNTQTSEVLTISTPGLCKGTYSPTTNPVYEASTKKYTWDCGTSLGCWANYIGSAICNNNGVQETGEECDGTDLNEKTCASVLGSDYTGTLLCKSDCTFDTSGCEKKGGGEEKGVCNLNINGIEFETFSDLDKEVTAKPCDSGTLTKNLESSDLINYNWKCGTAPSCSATIKNDPKLSTSYAIDGNCDNTDFVEIKYTNDQGQEVTRKIYCPAPLSFFTFWNIVAVLVVVGVFYVIMQQRKGKRKR